jgi:hypothetical protein
MTNYNYKEIVRRLTIENDRLSLDLQSNEREEEAVEPVGLTPQSEPQALNLFNKPIAQYFNPSHISEQNDEESFRPLESAHQQTPFRSQSKRMDSLGAEE